MDGVRRRAGVQAIERRGGTRRQHQRRCRRLPQEARQRLIAVARSQILRAHHDQVTGGRGQANALDHGAADNAGGRHDAGSAHRPDRLIERCVRAVMVRGEGRVHRVEPGRDAGRHRRGQHLRRVGDGGDAHRQRLTLRDVRRGPERAGARPVGNIGTEHAAERKVIRDAGRARADDQRRDRRLTRELDRDAPMSRAAHRPLVMQCHDDQLDSLLGRHACDLPRRIAGRANDLEGERWVEHGEVSGQTVQGGERGVKPALMQLGAAGDDRRRERQTRRHDWGDVEQHQVRVLGGEGQGAGNRRVGLGRAVPGDEDAGGTGRGFMHRLPPLVAGSCAVPEPRAPSDSSIPRIASQMRRRSWRQHHNFVSDVA